MGRGELHPLTIIFSSLLFVFIFFSPSVVAEIKTLSILSDSRPMILFEKFGFTHTGHVLGGLEEAI